MSPQTLHRARAARSLRSMTCPACGHTKPTGEVVCESCYASAPRTSQNQLVIAGSSLHTYRDAVLSLLNAGPTPGRFIDPPPAHPCRGLDLSLLNAARLGDVAVSRLCMVCSGPKDEGPFVCEDCRALVVSTLAADRMAGLGGPGGGMMLSQEPDLLRVQRCHASASGYVGELLDPTAELDTAAGRLRAEFERLGLSVFYAPAMSVGDGSVGDGPVGASLDAMADVT